MDYLSQIRGILFAVGIVLPTVLIAWNIGFEVSSPREFLMKLGEQRTVALLSAWGLIFAAMLFVIQLLPN